MVISTLYRRGKLLKHFILIAVALLLNVLLSWAFMTSLNCSVMCKPPWWFECYFRRSSWIHCWLPLAVLSDYFGQLVTSTSLLCKFRGLPGSTSVRFPVMTLWKWLGMKRLSQPVAQLPGNGLRNLPEISKFFIFSQKKPFGETFSKITIKVSKEFSFSGKPAKSEMLPHAI